MTSTVRPSSAHWLVGGALLAQLAFGFLLDEISPRGTPARAGVINIHKSIGVMLGVVIIARLVWRLTHRPLPWEGARSRLQQRAATLGHMALYVCMIVLPLSGYLASNLSRHGVRLFGLGLAPWGPDLPLAYDALVTIHDWTAIVLCVLIAGHAGAAIRHTGWALRATRVHARKEPDHRSRAEGLLQPPARRHDDARTTA